MWFRYPLNSVRRNSFGEKSTKTDDDAAFEMLAHAYADQHPMMLQGNDCGGDGDHQGLVHGADLLNQPGSLMDYLYFKHGTYMVSDPIPLNLLNYYCIITYHGKKLE